MMPYADSLKYMADWFAQLWAESLARLYTLTAAPPIPARPPLSLSASRIRHSQVQLYTEGPFIR